MVGLVMGAALMACGAESQRPDRPVSNPPPSAPSAPSAPTLASPDLPDLSRSRGQAGAEAFVRHYVALVNYAQATGDTDGLAAAGAQGCRACADFVTRIEQVYGLGGSIKSTGLAIRRLFSTPVAKGVWLVSVEARSGSETVTLPAEPGRSVPSERIRLNFTVEFSQAWLVEDVVIP